MNLKKWVKRTLIVLTVLTLITAIWANRELKLMYGGLTEVVDHTQFEPATGPTAITNVSVLSAAGDTLLGGRTVLVEDGLITAVASSINLSAAVRIIDGTGKYLIPGLTDAHVHLFRSPNDLLLYLANGVTQIREMIGAEDHLSWRAEIEEGRVGPKLFVTSPRMGSFGYWEGKFMSTTQGFANVGTAAEAERKVRELQRAGYDGVKVYSQLNRESYLAVTRTASALGMPVYGHIPWSVELADVWENGQRGVAHLEELMNALNREFDYFNGREEEFLTYVSQRVDEVAERLLAADISVTSTLWLTESFSRQQFDLYQVLRDVELEYVNPGIAEWVDYVPGGLGWLPAVNRYGIRENLSPDEMAGRRYYWDTYAKVCQNLARELSQRGVRILAGTDANLPLAVPGFSLHDELGSLQATGMSPGAVLRAATSAPGEWLETNTGIIAPGYRADLLLLDGDPLAEISNTKAINTVIANGRVYDRALLDDILAAVRIANDRSRTVDISEYLKYPPASSVSTQAICTIRGQLLTAELGAFQSLGRPVVSVSKKRCMGGLFGDKVRSTSSTASKSSRAIARSGPGRSLRRKRNVQSFCSAIGNGHFERLREVCRVSKRLQVWSRRRNS